MSVTEARSAQSVGAEWWRPARTPDWRPAATTAVQEEDSPIPFWAVIVFTFILLLAPQQTFHWLAHVRIALLTGALAVGAHCWTRFAARRPLMRPTREFWLAAALLGWAVVTLPLSEWITGSVQALLDIFLKSLIVFWLLITTVTTPGRLRAVAWGLSLMAAPLAATGVWHFLMHDDLAGRIIGYDAPLTQNPNDLAMMLNLILPLTVALLFANRRPAARGLLAGLIVLDASAVIVTFSRAGFLTLLTILALYLASLQGWRERRWAVAALLLAALAVPLLPSGYLSRLGTITNIQTDPTHSAQQRWQDTRAAVTFALSHPLVGAGVGMNDLALNALRGPTWQPVHDVYLEYAADLGWPGLALFILLLASCIGTAGRVQADCRDLPPRRDLFVLARAIRITLIAFGVAGFFYPDAYKFDFFYFAGLAVATGAVYDAEVRREPT